MSFNVGKKMISLSDQAVNSICCNGINGCLLLRVNRESRNSSSTLIDNMEYNLGDALEYVVQEDDNMPCLAVYSKGEYIASTNLEFFGKKMDKRNKGEKIIFAEDLAQLVSVIAFAPAQIFVDAKEDLIDNIEVIRKKLIERQDVTKPIKEDVQTYIEEKQKRKADLEVLNLIYEFTNQMISQSASLYSGKQSKDVDRQQNQLEM
ncbi:MAG: hypothetical protein IJA61_02805 [Clostridia bacterium]|nr:hypothetical protein [Clostridia bacterium]